MLVELSLGGEFQDKEHTLAVVEVAIHLEDVGVTKVALDLDLTPDLLLNIVVLQLVLVQHLEATDEPAGPLAGKIHPSKLALSERPANLKHAEVELLGDRWLV